MNGAVMDNGAKADKPEVAPTPAPTAQDFQREYQALCERMGFRLAVTPAWMARDDGTFSMVQRVTVEPLPPLNG